MTIQIKRYHLASALCLLVLTTTGVYSWLTTNAPVPFQSELLTPNKPLPLASLGSIRPASTSESEAGRSGSARGLSLSSPVRGEESGGTQPMAQSQAAMRVALTFDDGPHPEMTQRLLKLLAEHQVRATFFVVGKQVERYPELLQMIVRGGHEIANHSYSHRDMRKLAPEEVMAELERTRQIVEGLTGQKLKYFRPPGGRYNPAVVKTAGGLGYEMILWNVFPQDHTNPPARFIQQRALEGAGKDRIVLLHSGIENTLVALPGLIQSLRRKGCAFVTVSDIGVRP